MKWTMNRRKRLDGSQRLILLLIGCLTTLLGWIICTIPVSTPRHANAVARLQEHSGVESPVTAVLMNFRGYDTLLEVVVLLLAIIGAWSLTRVSLPKEMKSENQVQMGAVRLLTPLMCLVAAYLVWQGSHLAGGAFQGGAVFGAAAVLLLVTELHWLRAIPSLMIRIGLVLGPLLFLGVALMCLFLTGDLLGYPEKVAGRLILLIEAACAISIGLTLASLFAGGRITDKIQDKRNPFCQTSSKKRP